MQLQAVFHYSTLGISSDLPVQHEILHSSETSLFTI